MKILSDLPRNARNAIIVEPMWSVFGSLIFFYAPLYMRKLGLSEIEIGIVNTANLSFSFLWHFFAGPITNRLGRKRTTLFFDLVSWAIPMIIWAVAQNFWYFLIAYIINACVRVVVVSWNCLIIEDTPEDKRSKVFGILYLMSNAAGILTPLTGLLIANCGTVPVMRWLYALGAVSMTSMFLIRNALVAETEAGRELMEKHSRLSPVQSLKSYISTITTAMRNKKYIPITVLYIITSFALSMNFLQVIFLKEQRGFSEMEVSLAPGLSALISILLYIFVVPWLKKHAEEKTLTGALAIAAAGALMFLFIPKNNLPMLLVTIPVMAVGSFMMQSYRDAILMNRLGEHEKADVYAAIQTLNTLICIPSGYIAGYTYSINHLLPFAIIFVLFAVGVAVSLLLIPGKSPELKSPLNSN